jgi:hypothetical protein
VEHTVAAAATITTAHLKFVLIDASPSKSNLVIQAAVSVLYQNGSVISHPLGGLGASPCPEDIDAIVEAVLIMMLI